MPQSFFDQSNTKSIFNRLKKSELVTMEKEPSLLFVVERTNKIFYDTLKTMWRESTLMEKFQQQDERTLRLNLRSKSHPVEAPSSPRHLKTIFSNESMASSGSSVGSSPSASSIFATIGLRRKRFFPDSDSHRRHHIRMGVSSSSSSASTASSSSSLSLSAPSSPSSVSTPQPHQESKLSEQERGTLTNKSNHENSDRNKKRSPSRSSRKVRMDGWNLVTGNSGKKQVKYLSLDGASTRKPTSENKNDQNMSGGSQYEPPLVQWFEPRHAAEN